MNIQQQIQKALQYYQAGDVQQAKAICKKILKKQPDNGEVLYFLGVIYSQLGNHDLSIQPDFPSCCSNLLLALNYNPRHDMQTIFNEHIQFAERYGKSPGDSLNAYSKERVVDRRLRIGYVSPDFRQHPVAYFIEPVLRAHDYKGFEIFCYADVMHRDDVTLRIEGLPDHWRSIYRKSHEELAVLIRDDKIDILCDFAGHSGQNRLLVFARKPAPVQVTWIGYPSTTGLSTIDYKIVDRYTDPPGTTEQYHTENLIRMPDCFLCYLPEKDAPDVNELPALKNGYVTFGCFNNFAKVSRENLVLWSQILSRLPGSRLIMKSKGLSSEGVRESILAFFRQQGIEAGRIEVLSWTPSVGEHLALYNRIDVALDTFPYHGTTTTCEGLWMGVPVVTLEGETYASRAGVSLLSNVGLKELIAQSPEEYVESAVQLGADTERLAALRTRLRDMVSRSPLTDAKRFTANLEKAYREMWTRWCNQ